MSEKMPQIEHDPPSATEVAGFIIGRRPGPGGPVGSRSRLGTDTCRDMSDTDIISGEVITGGARDERGRFLTGSKPGPGRPQGSRNRHSENFLAAFADDFQTHGVEVIQKVRIEQPAIYLRIASDLLPKQTALEITAPNEFAECDDISEVAAKLLGQGGGLGEALSFVDEMKDALIEAAAARARSIAVDTEHQSDNPGHYRAPKARSSR